MKRCLLTAFLGLTGYHIKAQNLVINGNFDTYSSCPSAPSQISNATGWDILFNHIGTSDYLSTCATDPQMQVPQNVYGNEPAASGVGYAGVTLLIYGPAPEYREYITTQLSSPLVAGKKYKFFLKYSLADDCQYATDDLGVYFSSTLPTGNGTWDPPGYIPQISVPSVLSVKAGWDTTSMIYTAGGGEQYIVIGNFQSDANTTLIPASNPGWFNGSYLYFDDIGLEEIPGALQVSGDTVICAGDTAILYAHGNAPYQWATQNNPSMIFSTDSVVKLNPAVTTTYQVYGATDTVSFTVHVYPLPAVFLGSDTFLCGTETLLLNAQGTGYNYLWQDGSGNATFEVTQEGTYWVEVSDGYCYSSDTINIAYHPLPDASLGPDRLLCNGKTLTLTASPSGATYYWNTGATTENITVANPGVYWSDVTIDGCTDRDSIIIAPQLSDCNCIVAIPDVFSPNDDRHNDVFHIINAGNIQLREWLIYNRWGELIFRANNITQGWDGLHKGRNAELGTYFYYVKYYCERDQGEYFIKGSILLVR